MTMSEKYSSESTREQLEIAITDSMQDIGALLETEARARCPVDTGRLRASLAYEIGLDDVEIGSDVEYAPFVELRTHFLEQAGKKVKTQMLEIIKSNL